MATVVLFIYSEKDIKRTLCSASEQQNIQTCYSRINDTLWNSSRPDSIAEYKLPSPYIPYIYKYIFADSYV